MTRAEPTRLLLEARSSMEQFKAAELHDYYRYECVAEIGAKERSLDSVQAQAAMVYPILLPDRLELLVSLPSGIERYTEPVRFQDIGRTIRSLTANCAACALCRWLVASHFDHVVSQ
jgi:CHAT domain-containing protein